MKATAIHIFLLFLALLLWIWFVLTMAIAFSSSIATEEMRRVEAKVVHDFCTSHISSSTSSEFVRCEKASHHVQTFHAFWLFVLQRTIEIVAQDTLRILLASITNGVVFVFMSLVMMYGALFVLHARHASKKESQWRDYSYLSTDVEFGMKKLL